MIRITDDEKKYSEQLLKEHQRVLAELPKIQKLYLEMGPAVWEASEADRKARVLGGPESEKIRKEFFDLRDKRESLIPNYEQEEYAIRSKINDFNRPIMMKLQGDLWSESKRIDLLIFVDEEVPEKVTKTVERSFPVVKEHTFTKQLKKVWEKDTFERQSVEVTFITNLYVVEEVKKAISESIGKLHDLRDGYIGGMEAVYNECLNQIARVDLKETKTMTLSLSQYEDFIEALNSKVNITKGEKARYRLSSKAGLLLEKVEFENKQEGGLSDLVKQQLDNIPWSDDDKDWPKGVRK